MERVSLWDGSAVLRADAPRESLVAAVEMNLAARVRFFAAEPGARLVDDGESQRFINSRVYRVSCARFAADDADARIAALLEEARRRPRIVTWVVGPVSRPADLVRRLQRQGFFLDMQEPGMAVALAHLTPPPPSAFTDSLQFTRIDLSDPAEMNTFNTVASASFRRPVSLGPQLRRVVSALGSAHPHLDAIRLYLARLPSGEAVATLCTFVGAGAVGVYTVGTLPPYQRRGVASALTYHALMAAYGEGLQVGVLQASEQGQGVYRRLGFDRVCQVMWLSTY